MTESLLDAAAFEFALSSILGALTLDPARSVEDLKTERQAATAMLASLHPADAVQAALAARAVAMHHAAMECLRRAAQPEVPSSVLSKLLATSMALSRMSIQLMKALAQRQTEASRAHRAVPAKPAATVQASTAAANPGAGKAPAAGAQDRPQAPAERSPLPTAPAASAAGAQQPKHSAAAVHPDLVAGFAAMASLPDGLTPEAISIMTALTAQLAAAG